MRNEGTLLSNAATQEKRPGSAQDNPAARLLRKTGTWLRDREYRPIWHLSAVTLIIVFGCLLFYRHFHNQGMLMHADMTFPLTLDRITGEITNTWLEYGGFNIVQFIQNSPWILSFMLVAKVFGLSTSQYLLVMFVTTFSLAGVSMYALSYSTMRTLKPLENSRYGLFAGAFLAAIVYMYNPFSLFDLWPFMMYAAYALMPFIIMLLRKTFANPRPRYIIGLALLVSICSTHPTCMTWVWITITAYSLFFLIINRFKWRSVATSAKVFFPSLVLYLFINAAWTVPYLGAKVVGKPMVPAYGPYLTQKSLEGLSQSCTISNNLRLVSGYGQFGIPGSNGVVQMILTYALPLLAILCLVLLGKKICRNSTVLFLAAVSALSILVATGSSFILRRFYVYLVLEAPGSASYGWIFRSPNRLLFLVPVFYGLMIGIMVAWLIREAPRPGQLRTAGEVGDQDG